MEIQLYFTLLVGIVSFYVSAFAGNFLKGGSRKMPLGARRMLGVLNLLVLVAGLFTAYQAIIGKELINAFFAGHMLAFSLTYRFSYVR